MAKEQTLNEKTLLYWRMSRMWEGQSEELEYFSISQAFKIIHLLRETTSEYRPLMSRIEVIADEFIRIGGSPKPERKKK